MGKARFEQNRGEEKGMDLVVRINSTEVKVIVTI
jgi:hypothetical protein